MEREDGLDNGSGEHRALLGEGPLLTNFLRELVDLLTLKESSSPEAIEVAAVVVEPPDRQENLVRLPSPVVVV